jgi:hypothetical protein
MHVSDHHLSEITTRGFTVVENFVEPELLAAAQENLWDLYPKPDDYFAASDEHNALVATQFSGMNYFPFPGTALNQLVVHPDLVDAARRYCGTSDLDIYKIELWAKYSGGIDYDQVHHRDFIGHTLTVTKEADPFPMLTTFILLSDVTLDTGPTKVVPLEHTRDLPRHLGEFDPNSDGGGAFGRDAFRDVEVSVTGKAGTLFAYHPDIVHRGSSLLGHHASRFVLLVDFSPVRQRWTGRQSWPTHATNSQWKPAMEAMSPYERTLFGFPGVDDDFWDEQTIRDTGLRYGAMDMTPYRQALKDRSKA